jgi:uncharacterized membrane protein YgdD (TMEM256/DUF423 family)
MSGGFWIRCGGVLGFLAVAMGAFGAHGLKGRLDSLGTAANFQTAAQYHMYHALALVLLGSLTRSTHVNLAATVSGFGFLVGTLIFSGSLYILALTGQKWLGAITPIGGLALLAGWLALVFAVGRNE